MSDRPTQINDQLNNKTTFSYDAVNNRTTVKNPLGHTTTFSYDARNRLTVITQPDPDGAGSLTSPVTTFGYDAAGNRTTITDPLSRIMTTAYDAGYRVTSTTQPDPDGGGPLGSPITTFSYDNLDRLVSLKDPVNNLTTWSYDAVDQVLTETDPLGKVATYTHDAAGQLTRLVDRKNQRRDFAYDNLGRRTQEYWCPSGSGAASGCGTSTPNRIFTYSYDAAGQLTEVNETDSRYTFTYDNMGRVIGISSLSSNMPSVTLTNTYDTIGRRTAVQDNLSTSGKISFTYDAANRVTNVKMTVGSTVGPQVTLAYDAASRLTNLTRQDGNAQFPTPNKVLTTFTYDNTDRITAITHTYVPGMGSASTLATYSYSYNAASELITQANQDGSYTYTYDNTSQLTSVDTSGGTCGATGCDESFSYDVNGNRTMTGYTTGTGNRLTSDGTHNYTFDDNGNTLTKTRLSDSQKWEYTWDYRNRLTQVVMKTSGGTVLQQTDFTYDGFDRRIIKSFDDDGPGPHSAAVTKTLYDSFSFIASAYADFDGSNNVSMRYLSGAAVDTILARRDASGVVAWYVADDMSTVRDLVSPNGSILDHVRYSAFGKVTFESNAASGDRFKFTQREHDAALDIYYYRARYYQPSAGSFLREDPLGVSGAESNLFRYVGNSPTTLRDPTGLLAQEPTVTFTQQTGTVFVYGQTNPTTNSLPTGGFISGPNGAISTVQCTGPNSCNSNNVGGPYGGHSGTLTCTLNGAPNTCYTLTIHPGAVIASQVGGGGTVSIHGPNGQTLATGSAGVAGGKPVNVISPGPVTLTVTTGSNGTATVTTIVPSINNPVSAPAGSTVTFAGGIIILTPPTPVTPPPPPPMPWWIQLIQTLRPSIWGPFGR